MLQNLITQKKKHFYNVSESEAVLFCCLLIHHTHLTCSKRGVTLTGINKAQHSQRAPTQVTHTPPTA